MRKFLSLSIRDNLLVMTSLHEIFNCTVSPMMCSIVGGVDGTQGYRDGERSSSLFDEPRDAVSMWGGIIVADSNNYCLRNISDSDTGTFFGVCEEQGSATGDDEKLFYPMKLVPTVYDTLIVSDYLNLREVNKDGNGITLAVFDEPSYDILVQGNVIYVAFKHYIMKCQWTSMTHTMSTTVSPKIHDHYIAILMTIAIILVVFAIFVGVYLFFTCVPGNSLEAKEKLVVPREGAVEEGSANPTHSVEQPGNRNCCL